MKLRALLALAGPLLERKHVVRGLTEALEPSEGSVGGHVGIAASRWHRRVGLPCS